MTEDTPRLYSRQPPTARTDLPPITAVWRALGGSELRHGRGRAFWRDGDGLNVDLSDDKGCWYDFVAGEGGGVLDLVQQVHGGTRRDALQWVTQTFGIDLPHEPLTALQSRQLAQRRAIAEREAAELAKWRRRAIRTLRYWRNHLWDQARRAEAWMAGDGLRVGMDHPHTLAAIKAMSDGARLGDQLNEALERLLATEPDDVARVRTRLRLRKAA